jgi:hypothetical protein
MGTFVPEISFSIQYISIARPIAKNFQPDNRFDSAVLNFVRIESSVAPFFFAIDNSLSG